MIRKFPFWLRSILFLLLFILLYNLVEPIFASIIRPGVFTIEKLIEEQEDFDILIIGNSHASCSFVPEIIDHVLVDTNTLNLSSPNLGVSHAAILLRQIIESGNVPEAVVLEVFSVGSDMNDQLQISFFHDYSKTWQPNNLMWMASYYEPQQ